MPSVPLPARLAAALPEPRRAMTQVLRSADSAAPSASYQLAMALASRSADWSAPTVQARSSSDQLAVSPALHSTGSSALTMQVAHRFASASQLCWLEPAQLESETALSR